MEIQISLNPQIIEKLSRVGLILTRRYAKRPDLEDVLEAMAEVFLEKLDPERRAEKLAQRALAKKRVVPAKKKIPQADSAVPSQVKLAALRRDRNRCRHVVHGERCGVKKRVDIFAVRELPDLRHAKVEDVATLCQRHGRTRVAKSRS